MIRFPLPNVLRLTKSSALLKPAQRRGVQRKLPALLVLCAAALLLACADRDRGPGTGGITAHAVWKQTAATALTGDPSRYLTIPPGVTTVRAIITGPGMDPMQKDSAVSLGADAIDNVPAGVNRTLTLQGLGSGSTILYEGQVTGITVEAGATSDAGTIVMLSVQPGFTITPGSLSMSEGGTATSFTIRPNISPGADAVTVAISSLDTTEATVSPATLSWTSSDFSTPETVTVTPVDDSEIDGNQTITIELDPTSSTAVSYKALAPQSVSVTISDDDAPGFTITPMSVNTSEDGTPGGFTIRPNTDPGADTITVDISSLDTTEGTVSPATLSWTSADYTTDKPVTVTPVDDTSIDGNLTYTIELDPSASTETNYAALAVQTVSVTNSDDDAAGFTITPSSLNTTEGGALQTFTIRPNTDPDGDIITVNVTSLDTTEGTVSPATLSWTTVDYTNAFTVTVTPVDDLLDDGAIVYNVQLNAGTSTEPAYAALGVQYYEVTNADDDPPAPPTVASPAASPFYSNTPLASISGTCISPHTVNLRVDQTASVACSGSAYSFVINDPGADGTYHYSVSQTNAAGEQSTSVAVTWIYDTLAPAPITLTTPATNPVISSDDNLTLAGSCENGATVDLGGDETDSTTCSASSFSFTVNRTLDDTYNFNLSQTDLAGNISPVTTQQWIRDSTVPPTPVITTPATTPFYSPTLTSIAGTCTSDTAHTVDLTGAQDDSQACSGSAFSFTITDPGVDGTYTYLVSQTNDATGISSADATLTWVRDTTAPAAPALISPASSPFTAPGPLTISGTCEVDTTVDLSGDDVQSALCSGGTFGFTVDEAVDGVYDYTLTQTDLALNVSAPTNLQWDRQSTAVPPPVITVPSTSPYTSNTETLTIFGNCLTGYTVILEDVVAATNTPQTCSGETFEFLVDKTGVDGTYDFYITQEYGGMTSSPAFLQWIKDTSLPDQPIVTYAPLEAVGGVKNPTVDSIFEFHSLDTTHVFRCSLDGAPLASCVSPLVYSGLTGTHSIAIHALNAAGTLSVPDTLTWEQQTHATVALYHLDDSAPTLDDSLYVTDTPPIDGALTDIGTASGAGVFSTQARIFVSTEGDYMATADNDAHRAFRSAFTVETWVDFGTLPLNNEQMAFASKDDTSGQEWEFGLTKKGVNFALYFTGFVDGASKQLRSGKVFTADPGGFHHVALTWYRGTVTLFFDGVRITSRTIGTAGVSLLPDTGAELHLGINNTATDYFDGILDEVRISQGIRYTVDFSASLPSAPFEAD